ncbi:Putative uncharacterized protein [Moritella viscosa]|uniref:baseplate complex protein n=2 Tax=Moritella viscosa TaxID=80854 RepID=UPI000923B6AA|nr:hypothetical protein [Moritella viscosa]SHO28017.1 Putative uncharacterized protein [Moritella viscosa]
MIALDGWQVPGYETKIKCSFKLAGEDLSGYGSLTLSSDNGVKPAVLSVTTKIPFKDKAELAKLISKAKELDEHGARIIRTVNCDVAESFKVRKTKFDGEMSATEDEEVKAWIVSFNLLEVMSKSEREQLQLDGEASNNTTPQSTDGHNSLQQQFENVDGP